MPIVKRQIQDPNDPSQMITDYLISDDTTGHIVATGGAVGFATLKDGTTYDINEPLVEVASQEHVYELHHHIGRQHEMTGRFDNPELGLKFKHIDPSGEGPCKHCPPDTPPPEESAQAQPVSEGTV